MKTFKAGTWIGDGSTIYRVSDSAMQYEDNFYELLNAPDFRPTPRTLYEIKPKVGMIVKHAGLFGEIVLITTEEICIYIRDKNKLRVASHDCGAHFEVISEGNGHTKTMNSLSVEESLNERYVGLIGKWKAMGGWTLTSRLEESQVDSAYLNIAGMTYNRAGIYHTNDRSECNLVEFLGWEGVV